MADSEKKQPHTDAPPRQSKLSPQEIDALLKQSAAGVEYLRSSLRKVFRLPRYPLRLR